MDLGGGLGSPDVESIVEQIEIVQETLKTQRESVQTCEEIFEDLFESDDNYIISDFISSSREFEEDSKGFIGELDVVKNGLQEIAGQDNPDDPGEIMSELIEGCEVIQESGKMIESTNKLVLSLGGVSALFRSEGHLEMANITLDTFESIAGFGESLETFHETLNTMIE
jgi:hypothetical protein